MITASFYFTGGIEVASLVNNLQGLPESIRPIYFAQDEGKIVKANLLLNEKRFRDFRHENATGFFLYAENKTPYDISIRRSGYSEVTLYLPDDVSNGLVPLFFRSVAEHKPVFGFACDEVEYDHRNRYYITIGKNHIESWIGRKLEKYIPGVYWYTLISKPLLKQHGVSFADLSAEAISVETLGDGHLLKFFEDPEDWQQNAGRLDDLCERIAGVFSRRQVEVAMSRITDFNEYETVIGQWR
jgi:hypothetical protein